jgi:AraC-like DNA-binding protein
VIDVVFIIYLLWRVETLSDLCSAFLHPAVSKPAELEQPLGPSKSIEALLQRHCIEQQLYLQHDLTLLQLAKAVGVNRFYLSQHFSRQGTTYNVYINGLRIQHFIRLYHEAAAARQSVTAQQLAYQSGFRNYNTFSSAFKRVMNLSASTWMRSNEEL